MDLCLGLRCAAHICSNATKWGVFPVTTEEQLSDTWLVTRAGQRIHTALEALVPEFVGKLCTFRDYDAPEHQVRALWNSLHVDPHMLDLLVAVNLIFARVCSM